MARSWHGVAWATLRDVIRTQTGIGDPFLPFREILAQLAGDVET